MEWCVVGYTRPYTADAHDLGPPQDPEAQAPFRGRFARSHAPHSASGMPPSPMGAEQLGQVLSGGAGAGVGAELGVDLGAELGAVVAISAMSIRFLLATQSLHVYFTLPCSQQ